MNKKAEIDRLRAIVFKGAPEWVTNAAMDNNGKWWWYLVPKMKHECGVWLVINSAERPSIKQPETDLDWTETLISRGE